MYVKTLEQIASKYAPSRMLSFDLVHIFKVFQLLNRNDHVSRALLCQELSLGEGSIRTLHKHLKMHGLIQSTNHGTTLTEKGQIVSAALVHSIPFETKMPKCSLTIGEYNYAVLLKNASFFIKSGVEQRDAAIKTGAIGATTIIFKDKFMMPMISQSKKDPSKTLNLDADVSEFLLHNLHPENNDVIIIGSDNQTFLNAEFGAKNAALFTIMNHEKH
jgi:hypothetical protein